MNRSGTAVIGVLALLSSGVDAADKWLENRDAEELYAYVDVTGCPVSVEELRDFIGDQFVRSRIRLLAEWEPGHLALYVTLDCTNEDESVFIFNTTVMLARIDRAARDDVVFSFRHEDQFQSYGKGRRDFIYENVTTAIDTAFLKYLKANFDL
jgi:hypothetical protein